MSILLCIPFFVVALGITIYIHDITIYWFWCLTTSEVLKTYFHLGPFYPLLLKRNSFKCFFYIYWAPNRCCFNFCFNHQIWLQKLMRKIAYYIYPYFYPFPCCCFFLSEIPGLLLLSFSIWRTSFHHSLRVGLLMTHCLSFLSSEDVYFFFLPEDSFSGHRIHITYSFLLLLEKCCATSCQPPWFMVSDE